MPALQQLQHAVMVIACAGAAGVWSHPPAATLELVQVARVARAEGAYNMTSTIRGNRRRPCMVSQLWSSRAASLFSKSVVEVLVVLKRLSSEKCEDLCGDLWSAGVLCEIDRCFQSHKVTDQIQALQYNEVP